MTLIIYIEHVVVSRAEVERTGEVSFKQPSQKEIQERLQAKRDAKGSRWAKRAPKAHKPIKEDEKKKK